MGREYKVPCNTHTLYKIVSVLLKVHFPVRLYRTFYIMLYTCSTHTHNDELVQPVISTERKRRCVRTSGRHEKKLTSGTATWNPPAACKSGNDILLTSLCTIMFTLPVTNANRWNTKSWWTTAGGGTRNPNKYRIYQYAYIHTWTIREWMKRASCVNVNSEFQTKLHTYASMLNLQQRQDE